jgi:N6-L-threonylcarbamoyladenine synthase
MEYLLGIESTAHTFGIAIINKNKKIIVNEREMYKTDKGGIIPVEAAKHHKEIADKLYTNSLKKSGINEKDIKAIAFSQGPGLAPCLLEGIHFSKKKARELNIPLIPVNHCVAHLEIGEITGSKDPVLLYCSGANTQIIAYESGKYRIFGETLDIGIGNFIDTFGRYCGLGFPGGPKIAELADKSKNYIELPYSIKGMDVAFSGILTKLRQMLESGKYKLEDLSFSLQETVFSMLIESAERALAHTGKKELLLGGGVACNSRLQEMAKIMCEERGCKFFCPPREFLVDNAGMIAYLGLKMFDKGIFVNGKDIDPLDIQSKQRTDDVLVNWKD